MPPTMPSWIGGVVTVFALAVTLQAQQAPGGSNPCDPRLVPSKTDPLTYSRRGEVCEGVYFVPVSGSADLSLVAFTEPVGSFRLAPAERLYLQWAAGSGTSPVHVRAISLKKGVYYRVRGQGVHRRLC